MARGTIVIFSVGVLLGIVVASAVAAVVVAYANTRIHEEVIAVSIADSTHNLVPLLLAAEKDDLALWRHVAKNQITSATYVLDGMSPRLSDSRKLAVDGVLDSIARRREALGLGRFASPTDDRLEAVLAKYDQP